MYWTVNSGSIKLQEEHNPYNRPIPPTWGNGNPWNYHQYVRPISWVWYRQLAWQELLDFQPRAAQAFLHPQLMEQDLKIVMHPQLRRQLPSYCHPMFCWAEEHTGPNLLECYQGLLVFSWKHLEDHQLYMVPSEACCTSQPQAQENLMQKSVSEFPPILYKLDPQHHSHNLIQTALISLKSWGPRFSFPVSIELPHSSFGAKFLDLAHLPIPQEGDYYPESLLLQIDPS